MAPTLASDRGEPGAAPATVALPAVGRIRPRSIRRVVVLPAPLGPRKPVTEPGSTVKLRFCTAVTGPNRFVSCCTVIRPLPSCTRPPGWIR